MDIETAMLAANLAKGMADSAAARAESAAQEAEQSAEFVAAHSYEMAIEGKRLVITQPEGV